MQITTNQLDAIRDWAERTPGILAVYIFGSRAKGLARPDSDVDLAIILESSSTRTDKLYEANWLDWANDIEEAFAYPVELLRLGADTPKTRQGVDPDDRSINYPRTPFSSEFETTARLSKGIVRY